MVWDILPVKLENIPEVTECPVIPTSFMQSIYRYGIIIPPVLIVEYSRGEQVVLNIEDGRRRIQTAREINKLEEGFFENIECICISQSLFTDYGSLRLMLQSNQSENLLADYSTLLRLQNKYEQKDISSSTGMKAGTIKRLNRLDKLSDEMLEVMFTGALSQDMAMKCTTLTHEKQAELLQSLIKNNELTVRDIYELKRSQSKQVTDKVLKEMKNAEDKGQLTMLNDHNMTMVRSLFSSLTEEQREALIEEFTNG